MSRLWFVQFSGGARCRTKDNSQQNQDLDLGPPRDLAQEQGVGSHASLPGCHSEGPDRRAPAEGQSAILGPGKGLKPTAEGRVRASPELTAKASCLPSGPCPGPSPSHRWPHSG